jgi:DNA-binding FrmR family transcriptional regulator
MGFEIINMETKKDIQPTIDNSKNNTFEQVCERAWKIAEPQLEKWQTRLEGLLEQKGSVIQNHLQDLSVLYGKDTPRDVVVGLQYYPKPGSNRGEPMKNWAESDRLSEDTADVLYWVSEPSIPANASEADIDRFTKEDTTEVLSGILHEMQHQSFQGEKYQELIRQAEVNPQVQEIMKQLQTVSGSYVEITNELITTYLEQCGRERIGNSTDNEQPTPTSLKIQVDQKKSASVLKAIIKEDVEGWRDQGKGPGPLTDLRQQWEKILGSLPEGYNITPQEKVVAEPGNDMTFAGRAIYDTARKISSSLAKEYIAKGKPMDTEFVTRLYSLVEAEIQKL